MESATLTLEALSAIASLVSFVLSVLALAVRWLQRRGVKPSFGWRHVEAWGRRYPVLLSVAVGSLFFMVTILLVDSSADEPRGPAAAIATPKDGDLVPYQVRVEGSSNEVPPDTSPWLFVESNGDLYPQGGDNGNSVEIDRANGSWCGYAYFGRPRADSAGKEYVLILAIPTGPADEKLQGEMEEGLPVPHWRNLPNGFAQLAAARTVTRLADARSIGGASCR